LQERRRSVGPGLGSLVAGVAGGSEFFAELQLTPIYGHLPIFLLPAFAMDRSFEMVEPRLGFPDS